MDDKPSSHYHPQQVQDVNAASDSVRLSDLTAEALMAAAREQTGLERFGDECFLPGLRALLASLTTEAPLNAFGRLHVQQSTIGFLKNRLWANACFEAHPEILEREITAPIIIVGPHRSGTTRMQRMMSADSRLSHLRTWEGFNFGPRPELPELGRAERRQEVKDFLGAADLLYPGALVGHPMDADWAEEELHLLDSSWCGFSPLGLYSGIDSYYEWFMKADKTAAYEYMVQLIKLISWSRGEPEGKRWVLKNPQHMLNLDTLLKVFPDAKIVFTHRDPLKTVASVMSLMWHFAVQHTDANCRGPVRDLWLDFCEQAARRCIQQRELVPAGQQLDIYYEEMNADWRTAMRRVYDFAGLPWSAEAEQAMAAWLARSESDNLHGGHRYSLEDFGITEQEVDARMLFARSRHGIPYESKRS
ncbi:sulfotransferase family protein [Pseudoduganella namucuonensis]|uniref:Sulfotransferase family protein n=1 Tax=Pseudoduganella namucuonensis TaxID=1035707 RepID=A0A1I7HF59_9BURK|nr:sulfotransferase [Pseudoduganella namucuonensis]SFU59242.1 Sulfotransferase family protein [Pseudoduganella namucuonensis]